MLTWVHYRGLLVVALLAAGNLFCTGCPFVLVRDAGRLVRPPKLSVPRWLRTKWIGIALFVAVLFAYELFDLWALPRATAWLVLAYFASALVVDLIFTGATFCKYLCPIGQFNFVASMMSPLELRVKDLGTCRSADDGLHQGPAAPEAPRVVVQRGCELASLPAAEGGQHGLHVLPGLRPRLPARQHRARGRVCPAPNWRTRGAAPASGVVTQV